MDIIRKKEKVATMFLSNKIPPLASRFCRAVQNIDFGGLQSLGTESLRPVRGEKMRRENRQALDRSRGDRYAHGQIARAELKT